MENYLTFTRVSIAILVIAVSLLARFLQRLHFHRRLVKGLPGPPHSYIWGHLQAMGAVLAQQPPRAAPQTFALFLKEEFNLPDAFYFDPWPFGVPILMIFHPAMLHEIAVKTSLPKHPVINDFMKNFGGPGNLVGSDGAEWKKWRSAFNPGFSTSHLMTLVPVIVEQSEIFIDIMTAHARRNALFRMEPATTNLTVDIIGKIILDLPLHAQRGKNVLVEAFKSQTRWQSLGAQFNLSELWDIRRPIIQRYNNYTMDRYLSRALDARFASRDARSKTKAAIDLALEAYLKEVKGTQGDIRDVKTLDPEFKQAAISNMKTFVFAGHDTTSSTIAYAYYYLSKHPDALAAIRQEHDDVFGSDPTAVAARLREDPHLLNKLDYTLAVTREVLRLQPPASTIRMAPPGFFVHDPTTGEPLPTENFMLWPVNVGFHRHPAHWKQPHTFDPARFLPASHALFNPLYASDNRDAWIPFSKGPRNCIGQELALIETKVILAMTLRLFDFAPAYDELHALRGDGSGYASDVAGVQTQFGEEAYQVQLGTAKPREGMPCRLRLRG